jgi:hypothetical protein
MRIAIAALGLVLCSAGVAAQNPPSGKTGQDSPHSEGRTYLPPESQGVEQPQGRTGPLDTGAGGSPAGSPQGQSVPSMQAAPEGSSKTIVEPRK